MPSGPLRAASAAGSTAAVKRRSVDADVPFMGQLVLEKPAATKLLTAVEATLARLGAMRLSTERETRSRRDVDSRELARIYGAVRRMRDMIRRSIGLFGRGEPVEFSDSDQNLLVQCIAHRVSELEAQEQAAERPVDRRLHSERRQAFEALAEQIAIGPVPALPTEQTQRTGAAEGLRRRLAARAREVQDAETVIHAGGESRVLSGSNGPTVASTATVGVDQQESDGESLVVYELGCVRDPRLRSAVTMDLLALERARGRSDWRLAAVHLMSVVEAVLIDFALPRARTLGLQGGPEAWRLEALANACFDGLDARDRTVIAWLARCDSIVHPGRALRTPVLLTEQVLDDLLSSARELLSRLPTSR